MHKVDRISISLHINVVAAKLLEKNVKFASWHCLHLQQNQCQICKQSKTTLFDTNMGPNGLGPAPTSFLVNFSLFINAFLWIYGCSDVKQCRENVQKILKKIFFLNAGIPKFGVTVQPNSLNIHKSSHKQNVYVILHTTYYFIICVKY